MYNLAIRKCTSPPLLAPRLKIFKLKFITPPEIEPRICLTRGRHAIIWANAASRGIIVINVIYTNFKLHWRASETITAGASCRSTGFFPPSSYSFFFFFFFFFFSSLFSSFSFSFSSFSSSSFSSSSFSSFFFSSSSFFFFSSSSFYLPSPIKDLHPGT